MGQETEVGRGQALQPGSKAVSGHAALCLVSLRFCCWPSGIFFSSPFHLLLPHLSTLYWPDIRKWSGMKKLPARTVSFSP